MIRRLASVLILVLAGAPVAAHTVSPDTVLAALNGAETRARFGVVSAKRDDRAPRLLLIRVGDAWHRLPQATRRTEAARWRERWRHAERQGVVAVLDAPSGIPVVRYGPGGVVARLNCTCSP